MTGRSTTIALGLSLLASSAPVSAAGLPGVSVKPMLLQIMLPLPERTVKSGSRWLLPDVAESYGRPDPKPRLRIKGKKIKWWMPLG